MTNAADFIWWFRLWVDCWCGFYIVASTMGAALYSTGTLTENPKGEVSALLNWAFGLFTVVFWLRWGRSHVTLLMVGA